MLNQQKNCDMSLGNQLFTDYWHMVAHRLELPANNDFIKLKTPLGDVVIFNDGGELIAFDNRCAHRGALIYSEDFGNQPNTCRYHGWTFRGGRLHIPHEEQFTGCDIGNANLKKFSLDWCGDFLFLGVSPKQGLYEQLDEVTHYLENISFNIEGRLDLSTYEYECYWPLALENALEPYHIDMIHPQTLASLNLENGANEFYGVNSIWRAPIGNQRINKQLAGLNRFFNIDFQYEGYMSIFMFPFTMISSTYGFSYSVQNFFPSAVNADRTNFMSRLLVAPAKNASCKDVITPFLESSAKVNRLVFEEDHEICKLMPLDSWSSAPLRFISLQEEKIAHFRDSCRSAQDNA